MNSISGVQRRHTIQHSLLLGLPLLHLKLWPRGRQTAQHISWSQGHSTSPLISKSILQTSTLVWTAPDIPTQYTDNPKNSTLVLDSMFLWTEVEEFNNHQILPNLQSPSNYTSLLVFIIIKEEFIQERKQSIVRNSKKEKEFVNKLRNRILMQLTFLTVIY